MSFQQGTPLALASNARTVAANIPLSWSEYLIRKRGEFDIPAEMLCMPPALAMLTDGLSISMTILSAMHEFYGSDVVKSMEKVSVHILGATAYEQIGAHKYEEVRLQKFD